MEKLEAEARAKAAKHVANMLHTPDKLEKIDAMKFNEERKKASVEAMLKTAMQSQLDGVKTGLLQLEKAPRDTHDVQQGLVEIQETLEDLPSLELADIQRETIKHSQLAAAKENLKHIFMLPETVRQSEALITDGKLLDAHKSLVELENSRDTLLFELHKLQHKNTADKALLTQYFEPVTTLSGMMEKQIKLILKRTLSTVRKDPKVVVTALRVIEREEDSDRECFKRQQSTGFLPTGRPKKWKEKCMSVLADSVRDRIEGNQLESRSQGKMWLVKHLEVIRLVVLEDLSIAKALCQPVFPPHYKILEHFINLYHEEVRERLRQIISEGLEGQEYVTVLSWIIQTYPGKELMSSPKIGLPANQVRPLLDQGTIQNLEKEYLDNMHKNYSEWMGRTLSQEVEDWRKEEDPEVDNDGCFHTSAPIIIYQMIDENLQVAATISQELVRKVLILGMKEVIKYGQLYRTAIVDYKNRYFKDRTAILRFTRYMIAIVNNCDRFEELAQELKDRWWTSDDVSNEATITLETLLQTYKDLREESSEFLLDESFLDIDAHFSDLMTSKWQNSTDAIDTVCATLEDYFEDYSYLKKNFENVIRSAQDRVARRYITSMLQSNLLKRKISFERDEDRRKAAGKIIAEAEQLKRFFHRVAVGKTDFDSPFDALVILGDILKSDQEMMTFDIANLIGKYPDVSFEQLVCLLQLRGDLSRSEVRDRAQEFVPEGSNEQRSKLHAKSIFSQIQVSSSLNPFANKEGVSVPKNPFSSKD